MVRKGILIGTEALIYFELVDQNWTYQNSRYAEPDSSYPMEYRPVYCKKEEEPPCLILGIPHNPLGVHRTDFSDGPRPSAMWYTSTPIGMENTVPIYNQNKKLNTNPRRQLFSSAVTSEPNSTPVTNPPAESVGIAATYRLEDTSAYSTHDAPRLLPLATPPGSECVARNRPDTGPKKPVAVMRRLEHSYLQEYECSKLKGVTPSMMESSQWQLIKVLALQDIVNVMLPLLLEEEHQPAASDRGCSANYPYSSRGQQSTEEDGQANPGSRNSSCRSRNSSCPLGGLHNSPDAPHSKLDGASGFTCSGSDGPTSEFSTPVNTKTALLHIFQIEEEVFQNIYYNIMEIRSYRHAMLVTIHEVRSLPTTSSPRHDGGNSFHCVLRYVNRTTETKELYPKLSASNSICSLQGLNQVTEESVADPNDYFTAPSKPSKSSSKILKYVRHRIATKPLGARAKHRGLCSRPPQHGSSVSLSDAVRCVSAYSGPGGLLVVAPPQQGELGLSNNVSVCEDLVCETQTDDAERTARGNSCEAVWEQTFLCLTDSTTNSSLDFEVRDTKPSPTVECCHPNTASAPAQGAAVEADGAEAAEGGSLGHTSLALKNLDTSVEQNIALTLGEKVDYDVNFPSTPSTETETPSTETEETPSEVDIEDAPTDKQIDLTHDSATKK